MGALLHLLEWARSSLAAVRLGVVMVLGVDSDPRACHAVVLWQKTIGVGFGKDKPAPVSQVRHTYVPDRGLLL